MKIATRNLLAELLLEALDDHISATTIQCLASWWRSSQETPLSITVEWLLEHASASDHEAILAKLEVNPLLTGSGREQLEQWSLASAFAEEWQEIANKLTRFSTTLQEWSPGHNDTPRQHALKKGVLLFNHQLFFEVHEVLEAQWLQETGQEKIFLQGLIQIAVAFYHLENANLHGAQMLLQDGMAKLSPYRPAFLGIEVQEFLAQLEVCREEIRRLKDKPNPRFYKRQIPSMRLIG